MNNKILREVLATGERPKKPSALSASLTFGWRALLKIKHMPEQMFDVTAMPIIFLLMFTYLFGGSIAGSTGDYLQFILPGILVMTVTMITMYTGMALNSDITKGVYDRFRTLPIWGPSVLVGGLLIDVVRFAMASAILIVLGMILGFQPDAGVWGVLAAIGLLLLFAFSLSWIWIALAIVIRTEQTLAAVSMMVLMPLTFISNVLVDPETLPGWLQSFVDVNPISLLVTAVRGLMHGTATFEDIGWVLLASVIILAIFAPLTMYLYRNKE